MEKKKHGLDWGSLLLGVVLIIISLITFQNPAENLLTIVIVFAILAIFKGVIEILIRNRMKDLTGFKTYVPIVVGIIDIIIGIYLFFNLDIGIVALPFIFAIWFILDSFFGLFTLDFAKAVSAGYFWFSLILNILGVIIGVLLLFDPVASALTLSFLVGFYFLLFGILNIVYAFR